MDADDADGGVGDDYNYGDSVKRQRWGDDGSSGDYER